MYNSLVSVVIPTYNRAGTIGRAINSVLAQTYRELEVIVVDDKSTDNTDLVVASFSDNRIKFITNSSNKKGANVARNIGIRKAKGIYIAFLDSDDEWLPEKIEKQILKMEIASENVGLIYSGFRVVRNGKRINEFTPFLRGRCFDRLLISNEIRTLSTVFVKRDCLLFVDCFDDLLDSCQDWDLYIRLSKFFLFDFISDYEVNYYISEDENRISNNRFSVLRGHEKIIKKHKQDILQLADVDQATLYNNLSVMYIQVGKLKKSIDCLIQAFFVTGCILYLVKIFKRMAQIMAVKFLKKYGYN